MHFHILWLTLITLEIRDLGVIGSTTNDLLQALQAPKYQEAISHANYVTLAIGGDDLLQISSGILQKLKADPTYTPSTPELLQLKGALNNLIPTISSNLSHIVQEIRLLNPKAPILLYNLYNPFPASNPILHGLGEQIVTPANQIIGVVASNPLIILVDDHQAFTGNELTFVRLAEYDIHPTVEGQEKLAELGLKAINELP
jgi:lysophospholipase L1-like esterase